MKGIIGLLLFGTMMWGQTMAQYTIKLTVKQMAGKRFHWLVIMRNS